MRSEALQEYTLGKLIRIKHGFAFKGEYFSKTGHYVILTPGNFYEEGGFKLRPEKDRFYTGEFPSDYILKKGDLIVAMTEQAEGLLGCPAIIPQDDKFLHNQRLGLVEVIDKTALNKSYLYHLFNTSSVRQQIRGSSSGAKIRHTSPERMYRTKVLLPCLKTQEKIAAIVSAYDDLIANNSRRIALLEKMAEEVYREWFVRLRFPGHERVPVHQGVPEGWELIPVSDAFEIIGGGTPSKEEGRYWNEGDINWYTPSDITAADGVFLSRSELQCTQEGLSNSSARLFPPYSLMMTSRATIGVLGINTTPACTNQGFITCIPNERFSLTYLYFWLKLNKEYFELLSTGSTFLELIKSNFRKIEIIKPSSDVAASYDENNLPVFKLIETLLQDNSNRKEARDMLLSRLLSGKLDVEELDIRSPPAMAVRGETRLGECKE